MKSKIKSKSQVVKSHYFDLKYDTKQRWNSYWYQIKEVLDLQPEHILEIGVGNKTVSDYLRKIGQKVTTCDFDKSLKPDVVANVLNLPFKSNSFDAILCAEVLEHLPFKDFTKALKEIHRVTKSNVVLTLPHLSLTHVYFGIKLIPFIPKKEVLLKINCQMKRSFDQEHRWEIGEKGYPLSKIIEKIQKSGFKLLKNYYPLENPRHQFLILSKNSL